jgi:hypothetical protein
MTSTIGGDDPDHDLPSSEKDRLEAKLREESRELRRQGKPKEAKGKIDRANEISRRKSKRGHRGTD